MTALDDRPETLWGSQPVAIEAVNRNAANVLLEAWDHPLGPCNRPFGQDHWLLIVAGRAVALAVSASIVSPTIRDEEDRTWQRNKVLELARIARHPDAPWSLRPMLRLWREALAPSWSHWQAGLLVSYSLPGTPGDLYRFDGWRKARTVKRSAPGKTSTWGKPSAADAIGDGRKGLWCWHTEAAS